MRATSHLSTIAPPAGRALDTHDGMAVVAVRAVAESRGWGTALGTGDMTKNPIRLHFPLLEGFLKQRE